MSNCMEEAPRPCRCFWAAPGCCSLGFDPPVQEGCVRHVLRPNPMNPSEDWGEFQGPQEEDAFIVVGRKERGQ